MTHLHCRHPNPALIVDLPAMKEIRRMAAFFANRPSKLAASRRTRRRRSARRQLARSACRDHVRHGGGGRSGRAACDEIFITNEIIERMCARVRGAGAACHHHHRGRLG
jgi:hypothetical protein